MTRDRTCAIRLDGTILQLLSTSPLHGYGIHRAVAGRAADARDGSDGSIYPVLYRLESQGLVRAQWGRCAGNRRVRYYALTAAGRRRLGEDAHAPARHGRAGVAGALACGIAVSAGAAPAADEMLRVRSTSPFIEDLIRQGIDRSPTFRGLVDTIGRTDGIIYVEPGRCGRGVRACLPLSVTRAGSFRMLRVLVDAPPVARSRDADALIASVGHELRHAVEVLGDPAVTSGQAMYLFYLREAPTARDTFETSNAVRAGNQVSRELAASPAADSRLRMAARQAPTASTR